MPVGSRAIEDSVAHVSASGPAPAASANRLIGLFHASSARGWCTENYYRDNDQAPRWSAPRFCIAE